MAADFEVSEGARSSAGRVLNSLSRDGEGRGMAEAKAGQGLGWFSIGLGLMEALAPRSTGRLIGVQERAGVLRLLGIREIVCGIGLLAQPEAAGWRWARVAGDVLDLAFLGLAPSGERTRRAAAAAAVLGVAAVDLAASRAASRRAPGRKGPARAVVTIGRSPEDCYRAWTDPATAARAVGPGCSLRSAPPGMLRWTVHGGGTSPVEADVEVRTDGMGRVEWRSSEGAPFRVSAVVTFEPAPGGRGTVAILEAEVPGAAALPARVRTEKILRRFKQLLETGTIPTTEGQPSGRRSLIGTMFEKAER